MRVVSKTLRLIAALVMALAVAGFMLAFINHDSHEFFVALLISPLALIMEGASVMLDPDHIHSNHHPEHS
jgi:hypothetical protein